MKKMKIKPLFEKVLIREIGAKDKTEGGVLIPEIAKDIPVEGIIVAIGHLVNKEGAGLKVGDRVLFQRYAGLNIKLNGESLKIMMCMDIHAILEEEIE